MKTKNNKFISLLLALGLMAGVLGVVSARAATAGRVVITATNITANQIAHWGYDLQDPSRVGTFTTDIAKQVLLTNQMDMLRIPLWANNGEPTKGHMDASVYSQVIADIQLAETITNNITLLSTLKLGGPNGESSKQTFASWETNVDGSVNVTNYAQCMADYLHFFYTNAGIQFTYFGFDQEDQYSGGNMTATTWTNLYHHFTNDMAAYSLACPRIIGNSAYSPDGTSSTNNTYRWLTNLVSLDGQYSLFRASTHYYSNFLTNSAYLDQLATLGSYATNNGYSHLWNDEYHWDFTFQGSNDGIICGEAGLMGIFGHFDNGFTAFSFWEALVGANLTPIGKVYDGEMQTALCSTSLNGYPLGGDDAAGRVLGLGTFMTRSYKGGDGHTLYTWVLNNSSTNYPNKWFEVDGAKSLPLATPNYVCWTTASGEVTGSGNSLSGTNVFTVTIQPSSIYLISVTNVW